MQLNRGVDAKCNCQQSKSSTYALVSPQGLCENTRSRKVLEEKHSAMKADTSVFSESQTLTKRFALCSRLCNEWPSLHFFSTLCKKLVWIGVGHLICGECLIRTIIWY